MYEEYFNCLVIQRIVSIRLVSRTLSIIVKYILHVQESIPF